MKRDANCSIPERKIKYNWGIYDGAILRDGPNELTYPYDCTNTVYSQCIDNVTEEECFKIVRRSAPVSGVGQFVQQNYTQDKSNVGTCMPFRTQTTLEKHPLHSVHPVPKGIKSTVFINEDVYKTPPGGANAIQYRDSFLLKNVETGLFLESSVNEDGVFFSKNARTYLQIIPPNENRVTKQVNYNIDSFGISLPMTNLILKQSQKHSEMVQWDSHRSRILQPDDLFQILPIPPKSPTSSSMVSYDDHFFIQSSGYNTLILNGNEPELRWKKPSALVRDGVPCKWEFVPLSTVYYCNKKNRCEPTRLVDCNTQGVEARYKGKCVYRNKNCFCLCGKLECEKLRGMNPPKNIKF